MVVDTIIIRIPLFAVAIELYRSISMYPDVRQRLKHCSTDFCSCRRKLSAERHFRCGIASKLNDADAQYSRKLIGAQIVV